MTGLLIPIAMKSNNSILSSKKTNKPTNQKTNKPKKPKNQQTKKPTKTFFYGYSTSICKIDPLFKHIQLAFIINNNA
jgi:hypothetical protein